MEEVPEAFRGRLFLTRLSFGIGFGSHMYVSYGAVYCWTWSGDESSGAPIIAIHKLLVLDASDAWKNWKVEFDRSMDELGKVQGLLLQIKPM
jgi:hypothetical protein